MHTQKSISELVVRYVYSAEVNFSSRPMTVCPNEIRSKFWIKIFLLIIIFCVER